MSTIDKILFELDKIMEVEIIKEFDEVQYEQPNKYQSSVFGMTGVPVKKNLTENFVKKWDFDFLVSILEKMCLDKGLKITEFEELKQISSRLKSDEFKVEDTLPSLKVDMPELMEELGMKPSGSYNKVRADKIELFYELRKQQVDLLLLAFMKLTFHIATNNLDADYTYIDSNESYYYENEYKYNYKIKDCYKASLDSIIKCCELFNGVDYALTYIENLKMISNVNDTIKRYDSSKLLSKYGESILGRN